MSASKVTSQTLKAGLKCPPSKRTEEEDELFGLFKREMSSDSFPAASSEEKQPEINHTAMMKQPVIKLHRIGECMFCVV